MDLEGFEECATWSRSGHVAVGSPPYMGCVRVDSHLDQHGRRRRGLWNRNGIDPAGDLPAHSAKNKAGFGTVDFGIEDAVFVIIVRLGESEVWCAQGGRYIIVEGRAICCMSWIAMWTSSSSRSMAMGPPGRGSSYSRTCPRSRSSPAFCGPSPWRILGSALRGHPPGVHALFDRGCGFARDCVNVLCFREESNLRL
jgi:hypothetical protein